MAQDPENVAEEVVLESGAPGSKALAAQLAAVLATPTVRSLR